MAKNKSKRAFSGPNTQGPAVKWTPEDIRSLAEYYTPAECREMGSYGFTAADIRRLLGM